MTQAEVDQAIQERVQGREPDMYIGKGKRRKPIWIEYIGVKNDGDMVMGLDMTPEKVRERCDKFASGFGLVRKQER